MTGWERARQLGHRFMFELTISVPDVQRFVEAGDHLGTAEGYVRCELLGGRLPVEHGSDVWLLNWRASIDVGPLPWTLDDAAAYDHPAAVNYVLAETGAETVKAIVHCQGSTSFCMRAVAGLLPQVDVIVSNAVSLYPVIPPFSRFKIRVLRPVMQRFTPYLNPAWGDGPSTLFSRLARRTVMATHHECNNPVCRMVSFTYGLGRPALWRHENLNEATHEWATSSESRAFL